MLEIWLNLFVKFCFLFDDEVAPSMQKVRCESNARYIIAFPVQFLQVIAWFQSAIWKKHARVSFSKTSKQHESEGRVQFEEFEKPTSACLFQNQHEKLTYYLVIIYMTKLCRTEPRICVTCKIIYSLNCQYYINKEQSSVRTTEVKQSKNYKNYTVTCISFSCTVIYYFLHCITLHRTLLDQSEYSNFVMHIIIQHVLLPRITNNQ